jgi:hypothetical protein
MKILNFGSLDGDGGGGVKPISQIKIIRHLMSEIWKLIHEGEKPLEPDVDQMRPHEYFVRTLQAIFLGILTTQYVISRTLSWDQGQGVSLHYTWDGSD